MDFTYLYLRIPVLIFVYIILNTTTTLQSVDKLLISLIVYTIIDYLDCVIFPTADITTNRKACRSAEYQKTDKLVDLLCYITTYYLFRNIFDDLTKLILLIIIMWRGIGVLLFYNTNDTEYLKIFYDGINTTLLAFVLKRKFKIPRQNYIHILIVLNFVKIIYERYHRRNNYISSELHKSRTTH